MDATSEDMYVVMKYIFSQCVFECPDTFINVTICGLNHIENVGTVMTVHDVLLDVLC